MVAMKQSAGDAINITAFNDYERGTFGKMEVYQLKIDPKTSSLIEETRLADDPGYWWHELDISDPRRQLFWTIHQSTSDRWHASR